MRLWAQITSKDGMEVMNLFLKGWVDFMKKGDRY